MWVCCCWCLEKCHKLSQFDFFGCSWNFLIQSLGDFLVQITNYISNSHRGKLDCREYIISPLNLTPALCGSAWGSQLSPHPWTTRGLHQTVFGPPLPALTHHNPSSRSSLSPQRAFQDQRSSKAHHKEVSQRGSSSVVAAVCRPTVRVTGATTGVFGTSPLQRHMLTPSSSAVTHWPSSTLCSLPQICWKPLMISTSRGYLLWDSLLLSPLVMGALWRMALLSLSLTGSLKKGF